MKYLKILENFFEEYYIGDYILLKGTGWNVNKKVKVVDKYIPDEFKNNVLEYRYFIETYKNSGEYASFWVNLYEIERKLTEKEIEQLKLEIDTIKYNL